MPDFRRMRLDDLLLAIDWAAAEGWNPGVDDMQAFYATDPDGFFAAVYGEEMIASTSLVRHTADFTFLGLYICRPDFRGKGVGFGLWKHAIEAVAAPTIGLDGVAAQQDNYRKSGFESAGATLRLEGQVTPLAHAQVRLYEPRDFESLVAMDRAANGFEKRAFLTYWLASAPTRLTCVLENEDGAAGFATIRRSCNGARIGPLLAPDVEGAMRLIQSAAAMIGADYVIVDIPQANATLAERLMQTGMAISFSTARMYRGPAPGPGAKLQGVGTLELG